MMSLQIKKRKWINLMLKLSLSSNKNLRNILLRLETLKINFRLKLINIDWILLKKLWLLLSKKKLKRKRSLRVNQKSLQVIQMKAVVHHHHHLLRIQKRKWLKKRKWLRKKWKKKKPKLSHLHPLKVNLKKNLHLHQAAPHPNKVKKKKVMAKVKKILKKKLFNRDNYQRNMHF